MSKKEIIKIVLADDHPTFIDGIKVNLAQHDHLKVVGEANDGVKVLDILENEVVDIVVLDIDMPKLDGIETTKFIAKNYPNTKVLILSMWDKKDFIIKLMRYGASGYILKNKSPNELVTAIHNLAAGRTHYSLEVMQHAVAVSNSDKKEEVKLTEREIEVMKKIAEGFSSREIAEQLNISETTVNTHRRNIMAKLEMPSMTHLVRYAIKHGYVKL
ncbi:MAG: response regulator transcription factor [Bacteroidota bacterium]